MASKKRSPENYLQKNHATHTFLMIFAACITLFLTLFLFAKTITEFKASGIIPNGSDFGTISVSASADIEVAPDVATFSFTVSEEAETQGESQSRAADISNEIISLLKSEGIAEEDIETTSYNIFPVYEYVEPDCEEDEPCPITEEILIGYETSQSTNVTIRNVDDAGDILSAVGGEGAQYVSGLNFEIDSIDAFKDQARQKAIEKAKMKAEVLASQLGVRLDGVVDFYEAEDLGRFPQPHFAKFAEDLAFDVTVPDIQPGENTITSEVTIIYSID